MPWIIDYELVLEQMRQQRFKCLYYNGGAFGFTDPTALKTVGWIGPEDPTIRPAARPFIHSVPAPYEATLAGLAARVWQTYLPGRAWVMPMSHWAFELGHGSHTWLPALVERIGLDPGLLEGRNNAAAIEFAGQEIEPFERFIQRLLEMLSGSDFMIAFPGRPALCTLHHHKQLWWQTTDEKLAEEIRSVAGGTEPESSAP